MTILHLQTEEVQSMVYSISKNATLLDRSQEDLRNISLILFRNWEGDDSEYFYYRLQAISISLSQSSDNLHELANKVLREVSQWLEVDSKFSDLFSFGSIAPEIISTTPILMGTGIAQPWNGLNWGDWLFGESKKLWGISSYFIKEFIKQTNNNDDLTELIPKLEFSGFLFDLSDELIIDNESFKHAFINAGLSLGIEKGIKYLIPIFGEVMIASTIVQLVGQVGVAALEVSGNYEEALILDETLDFVDIGGYVDDIGDGITNWLNNPGQPNPFNQIEDRVTLENQFSSDILIPSGASYQ
jgi:hypothetical protein